MIKWGFIVLALYGGYYYFGRHVSLDSSLRYVSRNKGASWAPRANYVIGFLYHQREEHDKAKAAFTQLLTDYPTCQFAAPGLFYLEDSAESTRDWQTAKEALERYLEEHPDGKKIEIMRKRREMLRYQRGL
jgi:TolA-binding protein